MISLIKSKVRDELRSSRFGRVILRQRWRLIEFCRWFILLGPFARFVSFLETRLGTKKIDSLGWRRRRFERAFHSGVWRAGTESVSGAGSSLEGTACIREQLPKLLRELEVKTLLDIPCGDWNWMSRINLPVDRYIGGDIVGELIEANQKSYGDDKHMFRVIDLCVDSLPNADLILCRDALIHFSENDIRRALSNIKDAGIRYLATTSFSATKINEKIITGIAWRHLNLQIAPFFFPPPKLQIADNFNRPDQFLGVWPIDELPVHHG